MSDVIPLSRFMYDLRNLCSEGQWVERIESVELVEKLAKELQIRVRNLVGLCATVIRYDELTDDEIRRLEPSAVVAKTELVLREILADDNSPLETLLDNLPRLRKYLDQLPPLDEPKRFAVKPDATAGWPTLSPDDLRKLFKIGQDALLRRLKAQTYPNKQITTKAYLVDPSSLPDDWKRTLKRD